MIPWVDQRRIECISFPPFEKWLKNRDDFSTAEMIWIVNKSQKLHQEPNNSKAKVQKN